MKDQQLKSIRDKIQTLKKFRSVSVSDLNLHQLKNWAEYLECFGEEFEYGLNAVSFEDFEALESLCKKMVLASRLDRFTGMRSKEHARRARWRRRIRYAAGFILDMIEIAREEAIQEDNEIINDFAAFALSKSSNDFWVE